MNWKSFCFGFLTAIGAMCLSRCFSTAAASPPQHAPEYKAGPYWLDAGSALKLRHWQAALDKADEERDIVVDELIEVIADEQHPCEERREAVFMLGRIGTPRCLDFLIRHISLFVPKAQIGGDADLDKERPCMYALTRSDWRAAEAVLSSLEQRKADNEHMWFAYVLRFTLGGNRPDLIVNEDLRVATKPEVRRNLTAIRDHLHHH